MLAVQVQSKSQIIMGVGWQCELQGMSGVWFFGWSFGWSDGPLWSGNVSGQTSESHVGMCLFNYKDKNYYYYKQQFYKIIIDKIVEINNFFCNCHISYHPISKDLFISILKILNYMHQMRILTASCKFISAVGKLIPLPNCSDLQQFKKNRNSMKQQTSNYILIYLRVNGCSFWFNIFQIMSTISMLTLLYLQITHYLTALEIFITLMVVLDLAMRLLTEGLAHFAASWDNRIHLLILGLLAASICWDLVAADATHHDGGIIAGVFLFIRYSVQISRLFRLILDSKKQLEISHQQEVSLNESIELESSERTH